MNAWRRVAQARRGWLLALLLALLHAQGLGLWHRVAHAPRVLLAAASDDTGSHAFGHTAGDDAQCQLYDQLTTSDAASSAPCATVAALPAAAVRVAPGPLAPAAAAARHYQARAPPQG